MPTILTDSGARDVAGAQASGDDLWVARGDIEAATGWTLKPEGLCQGDVCVPLPPADAARYVDGDRVNLAAWWRLMARPVLHDTAGEYWMLGAGADQRATALQSLEAPDFTLPDVDGTMHSLSDYRGKRVFLTTWSSW
jgi:hypothetical protein